MKIPYLLVKPLMFAGQHRGRFLILSMCFVLMFSPSVIEAQPQLGWIPFDETSPEEVSSHSYMKDETTTGLLVNFDIPGMYVHNVEIEGVVYQRLSIPGKATSTTIGKPEIPLIGQIVEIPYDVDLEIEIVKSTYRILKDYNVYPVQEPAIDHKDWRRGDFKKDTTVYKTNAFYPMKLVDIKRRDFAIMRGHRIVLIKVNPVQYNPVTKEMRVYSNLEVRLQYSRPAQVKRIDIRLVSPAFEEFLDASVLNYKKVERFDWRDYYEDKGKKYPHFKFRGLNLDYYEGTFEHRYLEEYTDNEPDTPGCDYLIITHGNLYNANDSNNPIVRFRNWKRQKGLVTDVVTLSDIPDSDNDGVIDTLDIKVYIQDIYDTWSPPPTYILFIGDVGDNGGNIILPTIYRTPYPSFGEGPDWWNHNETLIPTDLYYCTVDGNDYFPDIFFGRLCVDNVGQATDVIDKILAYEQNPPPQANNAFYTDASLIALFEDVDPDPPGAVLGNGIEDRPWIEVVEEVWQYLDNNGYNPERIYNTSGVNVNPQFYENGVDQPPTGIQWNGGPADIRGALNPAAANDGRFLAIFRDHGGQDEWSEPHFDNADVDNLVNGNLTPVIFSLACQTGWFDNESDDDANLPAGNVTADADECFCEHFIRNNNGGAVAIIGATRNSFTGFNDFNMFGMVKSIWPDFNPNPPLKADYPTISSRVTSPIPRMGQICTFGKVYMANAYSDDIVRQVTFEFYHVFGDPEMPIWSEEPADIVVDHPDCVGSTGNQDFVVKVSDNAGDAVMSAVVSLTRDGEIISAHLTNAGGFARFTRSFLPGNLNITVTALGYRPYMGTIEVTPVGAVINRLNPDNGTEGQPFNVGAANFSGSENVDIYLNNILMTTKQATNGEFGQTGIQDVSITIPQGHAHGLFNLLARGQTSGRCAVDVLRVRDANPVDLYTYCQGDNSTWHLHAGDDPTWNNPEITLFRGMYPVQSGNLSVGQTYRINAVFYNDTDFDADNSTVTFRWAAIGAGQATWNTIGTDIVNVSAHNAAVASIQWTPPVTGHVCLTAEIYHVEDIKSSNNYGQENCHVEPTSSPAAVPFLIWNPSDRPAALYLELRQLTDLDREVEFWPARIVHADPQVLAPGDSGEASVIIDVGKGNIELGESEEFSMTGYIDDNIVGGVNFIIVNQGRKWSASIHSGVAIPTGSLADDYVRGPNIVLDFGRRFATDVSVLGFFGYNVFLSDIAGIDDTYWLNFSANLKYSKRIRRFLSLYLAGGPGYYVPETGDNAFGGNIGAGLDYQLRNCLLLELGADYNWIFDQDIQFAHGHAGVIFRF